MQVPERKDANRKNEAERCIKHGVAPREVGAANPLEEANQSKVADGAEGTTLRRAHS